MIYLTFRLCFNLDTLNIFTFKESTFYRGRRQSPLDSVCKYTSENGTYKSYSSPIRYNFLPLIESLLKCIIKTRVQSWFQHFLFTTFVAAEHRSLIYWRIEHVNIYREKKKKKKWNRKEAEGNTEVLKENSKGAPYFGVKSISECVDSWNWVGRQWFYRVSGP